MFSLFLYFLVYISRSTRMCFRKAPLQWEEDHFIYTAKKSASSLFREIWKIWGSCIFQKGFGEGGTAHQFLFSLLSETPSGIKLSQSKRMSLKVFNSNFLILNLWNGILFPVAGTGKWLVCEISLFLFYKRRNGWGKDINEKTRGLAVSPSWFF